MSVAVAAVVDEVGSSFDPIEAYEDLELDYEEECNRAVEMKAELRAAQIEAQQLRLRLKAVKGATSCGPTVMPAFSEEDARFELRVEELRRLFHWLSCRIDIDQAPTTFTFGFEVAVAGRAVHLNQVAQWRVRSSPPGETQPVRDQVTDDLRLTVPLDIREDVASMLRNFRHGLATASLPISQELRKFASAWDMIAGQVSTSSQETSSSRAKPAVLLAHQDTTQGILLASWPMEAITSAMMPPQTNFAERLRLSVGERVEVFYDGEWFKGHLKTLLDANGMLNVQCDVDPQGTWTPAPPAQVRPLPEDDASPEAAESVAAQDDATL